MSVPACLFVSAFLHCCSSLVLFSAVRGLSSGVVSRSGLSGAVLDTETLSSSCATRHSAVFSPGMCSACGGLLSSPSCRGHVPYGSSHPLGIGTCGFCWLFVVARLVLVPRLISPSSIGTWYSLLWRRLKYANSGCIFLYVLRVNMAAPFLSNSNAPRRSTIGVTIRRFPVTCRALGL